MKKRFAVVLAGCGVFDGAEIQEAVLTLLAIDKLGATYQCFSPDINQYHVINHLSGEVTNESRNVLVESARIARGNIMRLRDFNPSEFDAIVFPGGFGVAKNLCTFAIDGPGCLVNPIVETAIIKAKAANMPIGALCVAPALLAKVLGDITITIGNDFETTKALEKLGATHIKTHEAEIVIDNHNKIVTSPCYMLDSPISTVAQGIENTITELLKMIG